MTKLTVNGNSVYHQITLRVILVIISGLIFTKSYSQIEVKNRQFKLDYVDNINCMSFKYNFSIPQLNTSLNEINDSIAKIAESAFGPLFIDGASRPNFDLDNKVNCDSIDLMPYETIITYNIILNNDKFFSLIINVDSYPGGNASENNSVTCLNIDIKNNQVLTENSLFGDNYNFVLDSLVLKRLGLTEFEKDDSEYIDYKTMGFTINETEITFYIYKQVMGSHYSMEEIKLPISYVKKYIVNDMKENLNLK